MNKLVKDKKVEEFSFLERKRKRNAFSKNKIFLICTDANLNKSKEYKYL